ncbi:MAG: hypothetical protein BMS9Abin37_1690 [Acidobacteriota bacterium]|nr:MAG: hypothetical protein BMS9Abin37_1690 [Acidobacteriota bacterium]
MASYPLLELSGSAEELEIATALVHEYGCLGTEQRDDAFALYAYFPDFTNVHAVVDELRKTLPSLNCHIAPPLPSRDWLAEWKAELEGFPIGSRYFVLPTWKPEVDTTRRVLRIDPEQAFGTGTHETTQLSVELVEDYVAEGCRVVDVGTGTGILSMVAAHEGARAVLAIDVDPAAVECARANLERNGLSDKVRVECASWEELESTDAEVVIANINTAILTRAVHSMFGTILLSGLLVEDVDDFTLPDDSEIVEQRSAGEWAALVIQRARHE